MAPKNQDPKGANAGKGKITVVMFQLEGSDDTLRDAIRVMGHGLEKLAPSAPVYKVIQAPRSNGALSPGESEVADAEVVDGDETEDEETASASSQNGSSEKPPRARKPPKAIAAAKGIDWESEVPWRDFAKQKSPDGNPQRFVAVAGWFRNHRQLEVITPGHIVAAFDVMDWPKPENIANTFAQLKNKRSGELFDKGEKTNEWVLSQRGVNLLDRLGKEKAK